MSVEQDYRKQIEQIIDTEEHECRVGLQEMYRTDYRYRRTGVQSRIIEKRIEQKIINGRDGQPTPYAIDA